MEVGIGRSLKGVLVQYHHDKASMPMCLSVDGTLLVSIRAKHVELGSQLMDRCKSLEVILLQEEDVIRRCRENPRK